MPAKGRVSLAIQIIFCLIPLLDIYAAYRIKKLRWYLLIMLTFGIIMGVIDVTAFPAMQEEAWDKFPLSILWFHYDYDDHEYVQFLIIADVAAYVLAIFLILRWSLIWNKQFEWPDGR